MRHRKRAGYIPERFDFYLGLAAAATLSVLLGALVFIVWLAR